MNGTTLTGGCFCGAVRYRIDAAPKDATLCHCSDCRRLVGAHAVAWFSVPFAALEIVQGALRTFASSPDVVRGFCAECGTSLTYKHKQLDTVDVTTASLDDPGAAAPADQIWIAERLAWVHSSNLLPAFAGARPLEPT